MKKKNDTTTYFLYARKSSESDERQVQSIDDQVADLSALADDFGLHVARTFHEAKSAKEPHGRPVFEDMLARIERGEADGILAWKIDRLSRNPIDSARIQWMLQQGTLASIRTMGRDYLPDDNALLLSVESSMANQYIRDLSRNVKRGMGSKVTKGWRPGIAPSGYLNTKRKERGTNTIVVDPTRFPLIKRAWEHMLTGAYTVPQLLKILNNQWGYRTKKRAKSGGGPLTIGALYKIFTNPFYAGLFWYNGVLHSGRHKPMITLEEFDRVQLLLGRAGRPRPITHSYAYTGLLTCGECGGTISATTKTRLLANKETATYVYYYCTTARRNKTKCSERSHTKVEHINAQIAVHLAQCAILPEFKAWADTIIERRKDQHTETHHAATRSLRSARDAAEQERSNLTKLRLRDLIDDTEYLAEKNRLTKDIARLRRNITDADNAEPRLRRTLSRAFSFAADAPRLFSRASKQQQSIILAALGSNHTLHNHSLALQSRRWLTVLQEKSPPLIKKFKALKTNTRSSTDPHSGPMRALFLQWCAIMDDVETALDQEGKEYEVPDLTSPD